MVNIRKRGVDLWQYHNSEGSGIRKALDFLVPYVTGKKSWPYPQKDKIVSTEVVLLLRRAARAYKDQKYEQLIHEVTGGSKGLQPAADLLYPAPANEAGKKPARRQPQAQRQPKKGGGSLR
jgi:hypothetical protein